MRSWLPTRFPVCVTMPPVGVRVRNVRGDPQLQDDVDQFRRNFDDPILLGGMCNGLAQIVLAVQSRAARPGRGATPRRARKSRRVAHRVSG